MFSLDGAHLKLLSHPATAVGFITVLYSVLISTCYVSTFMTSVLFYPSTVLSLFSIRQ